MTKNFRQVELADPNWNIMGCRLVGKAEKFASETLCGASSFQETHVTNPIATVVLAQSDSRSRHEIGRCKQSGLKQGLSHAAAKHRKCKLKTHSSKKAKKCNKINERVRKKHQMG